MIKRLLIAFVAFTFMFATGALAETNHINDNAQLLSKNDVVAIDAAIAKLQKDTNLDFAVLTTNDYLGDDNGIAIGQYFYTSQGYGLDASNSGLLFYIDMSQMKQYIVTMGYLDMMVSDDILGSVMDGISPYLAGKEYKDGILHLIQYVSDTYQAYMESAITTTATPAP